MPPPVMQKLQKQIQAQKNKIDELNSNIEMYNISQQELQTLNIFYSTQIEKLMNTPHTNIDNLSHNKLKKLQEDCEAKDAEIKKLQMQLNNKIHVEGDNKNSANLNAQLQALQNMVKNKNNKIAELKTKIENVPKVHVHIDGTTQVLNGIPLRRKIIMLINKAKGKMNEINNNIHDTKQIINSVPIIPKEEVVEEEEAVDDEEEAVDDEEEAVDEADEADEEQTD